MIGLVEQLQRDALEPKVPVVDLLRKVKVTAVKLKLGQVENWVDAELSGYSEDAEVPTYRYVTGQPRARYHQRGWMPIGGAPGAVTKLSRAPLYEPIASLESLLDSSKEGDRLQIPYHPETLQVLSSASGGLPVVEAGLAVSRSSLVAVVEAVRTAVLDWALELERAGITGSEISFADDEKELAVTHPTLNFNIGSIANFAGNLGAHNVSGRIVQTMDLEQVRKLVEQLQSNVPQLLEAGVDKELLADKISELTKELETSAPNESRISGILTDLRMALAGAAGNLVSTGALALINQILGTGVPA